MRYELLAPMSEDGSLRDFLRNLGFILVSNHCRRNCLHCPAYGDRTPVQTMPFRLLRQFLAEIDQAYRHYEMVPQRSIACWRISDPLDLFARESGEKRTLYDVAQLWLRYLHQGLYVVTNGSEGKAFAHEVLTQLVQSPELIRQIKLTITPCDQGWGTERYFAHLLEDIRILSPLWKLPSLRSERPADSRFRINLKVTPERRSEAQAFVGRLLKKLGYPTNEADQLLRDPARIAIKPIYDLSTVQTSPVAGAQSLTQEGQHRYKPTPEERTRYQYGVYPDGRLFVVDMYAFAELPATTPSGAMLALAGSPWV